MSVRTSLYRVPELDAGLDGLARLDVDALAPVAVREDPVLDLALDGAGADLAVIRASLTLPVTGLSRLDVDADGAQLVRLGESVGYLGAPGRHSVQAGGASGEVLDLEIRTVLRGRSRIWGGWAWGGLVAVVEISWDDLEEFQPGRQSRGGYRVEGVELHQLGNSWLHVDGPFDIGPETRVTFEVRVDVLGEIHGIMLTDGEAIDKKHGLRLAGRQDWGHAIEPACEAGAGWRAYDVAVGRRFTGRFERIVFISDDDAGEAGQSAWRRVRLIG